MPLFIILMRNTPSFDEKPYKVLWIKKRNFAAENRISY